MHSGKKDRDKRSCSFSHPPPFFLTHSHITKIFDRTKLKALADDNLNVTKMTISVFDRVENIVGKGEIACTSNFSFSHNVFKMLLSQTCQKVSLRRNGLTSPNRCWTVLTYRHTHTKSQTHIHRLIN